MASVKAIMACLGISTTGNVSILGDLCGFITRRVPTDPDSTVTAQVSMLDLLRGTQGAHVHVNVIRVGFDGISGGTSALDAAHEKLDYALYRTRRIYRQVSLGVGRVQHWFITSAQADGKDNLGSEDEADELIAEWSVPNEGIDAFVVRNISADFVGKASEIPGVCDKEASTDGVVAGEIGRDSDDFARTFAHEMGHHLKLFHNHDAKPDCPDTTAGCNNLMAQTRCADNCGDGTRAAVLLTSAQGVVMRSHCSVQGPC